MVGMVEVALPEAQAHVIFFWLYINNIVYSEKMCDLVHVQQKIGHVIIM